MPPRNAKVLNFRQLEVFRAIMVARSISDAAKLLFVSQPAISRGLAQTEAALGFLLFERVKGRLYPTPEATRLFAEVEDVFARLDRINEVAHDFSQHRGGMVRVLAHSTMGHSLVPDAIAAFRSRYPAVPLAFETTRQQQLEQRMVDGLADLAVSIFSCGNPSLASVPLGQVPLACVMSADHPLAGSDKLELAALRPYPLLSYSDTSPFGSLMGPLLRGHHPMSAKLEVGSPQNACYLVKLGLGLALMDSLSAMQGRDLGLHVSVVTDAPLFNAVALHHRYTPLSDAGNLFLGTLLDRARAWRP